MVKRKNKKRRRSYGSRASGRKKNNKPIMLYLMVGLMIFGFVGMMFYTSSNTMSVFSDAGVDVSTTIVTDAGNLVNDTNGVYYVNIDGDLLRLTETTNQITGHVVVTVDIEESTVRHINMLYDFKGNLYTLDRLEHVSLNGKYIDFDVNAKADSLSVVFYVDENSTHLVLSYDIVIMTGEISNPDGFFYIVKNQEMSIIFIAFFVLFISSLLGASYYYYKQYKKGFTNYTASMRAPYLELKEKYAEERMAQLQEELKNI